MSGLVSWLIEQIDYLYSLNTKNMLNILLIFGLGTQEVILIGIVILLFFGAKKIPDLAKGLGKGIREFKDAMSDVKKEVDDAGKEITKIDEK